ncbi:hypothetical protein D5S18_23330 [Nocardia panacis]|uniref:DUF8020 domain-containing protein n=1 Tax=Nocardia panacis TaxID=2340916 RepID=A0A3A4JY76_9NOCA|nr:hypothetical protein [Nocardia panacis]RJO72113.1 hypothetical protein D5S18_23330 [Nocardia panacis]
MGIRNITVAALFTVAATGLVGGIAHADPVAAQPNPAAAHPNIVHGTERGVAFEVAKSSDGKSLSANLFGGHFALTDNSVTVTDNAGALVATLPRTVALPEGTVELRPEVEATGTHLTATPVGRWVETSPRERSIGTGLAVGLLAGAMTGAIIGLAIGIAGAFVLAVITAPIGFLAGALIGGAIGAGIGGAIPNSDVKDRNDYRADCYESFDRTYCW